MSMFRSFRLVVFALVLGCGLMVSGVPVLQAQAMTPVAAERMSLAPLPPTLDARVSFSEESLRLISQGVPNGQGTFRVFFETGDPNNPFEVFEQDFVYDENGEWRFEYDLRNFESLPGPITAHFGVLQSDGVHDDPSLPSITYKLTMNWVAATSPNAPAGPSGNVLETHPTTQAPLTGPASWANLLVPTSTFAVAGGGSYMVFACAPHGVEGVIPVH